ncbi:MAG: GGDEF domain-containing protein [Nitrospirota bacterium]
MQIIFENELISYLAILVLIIFSAYFWGSKRATAKGEKRKDKLEKMLNSKIKLLQSQNDDLHRDINVLNEQIRTYLNFVVNIPDAVKNINSILSVNDLITSIIRLTEKLIVTDEIEIYTCDKNKDALKLIAALGTNRGESVQCKVGKGVVGGAAETRMIFEKDQLEINSIERNDEKLEFATPIIFQKELFGVLGIGKIKKKTENDKTFLAMIADLSAVAFKNCEYLRAAKEEAIKDALTGLYNKKFFLERGEELMGKSTNYDHVFSIFIFDIDNFKDYNDTNGHVQGDVLLAELGKLLKEKTRATNLIARYGGEEFIVLLENTDKHKAEVYAEDIRKAIETHPFQYHERQPLGCVSISGGISEFPVDGALIKELIEKADKALYESKESGRNRISLYEPIRMSVEQVEN